LVEGTTKGKILDFSVHIGTKAMEENATRIFNAKSALMQEQKAFEIPMSVGMMSPSPKVEWLWQYALEHGYRY